MTMMVVMSRKGGFKIEARKERIEEEGEDGEMLNIKEETVRLSLGA